ncbi:MAG: Ribosomal large subunit pseudouridine synthase B [Alphaproteobacteria bacterium MarineAlpha11_Bin1]|nr:MAG: Ribosomal large subunit pseudouridine synthase B [Alphaproteobacteria bacterium MarineAlpha11_Bin1]|tara:strand:- start:20040 stop:20795 length:756 start_codon:yes stop_codon:yes gene_type:complete
MIEKSDQRIAKRLSRAGVCSRREAERWIREGRISVDGREVSKPGTLVTEKSIIRVDGKTVAAPQATRLWRYHKPPGLICTNNDPNGRSTIYDRLPDSLPRVMSVGRLDFDSEGLLLLTNDGSLARHLELPETGWTRRYRVRMFGIPDEKDIAALKKGIVIEGTKYGAIEAVLDSKKGANAWLTVSLREGKNRELRKVFNHLGYKVSRLIRTSYGPFQLGKLDRGGVEGVPKRVLKDQIRAGLFNADYRRQA